MNGEELFVRRGAVHVCHALENLRRCSTCDAVIRMCCRCQACVLRLGTCSNVSRCSADSLDTCCGCFAHVLHLYAWFAAPPVSPGFARVLKFHVRLAAAHAWTISRLERFGNVKSETRSPSGTCIIRVFANRSGGAAL